MTVLGDGGVVWIQRRKGPVLKEHTIGCETEHRQKPGISVVEDQ